MKNTTLSTEDFALFLDAIPRLNSYKLTHIIPTMKPEDFQFLFILTYFCALRASEVINLKKSDFDFENKLLTIRKKEKNEITTILPNLSGELHNKLKKINDDDYLFVTQKSGQKLKRQAVWIYAKNAGKLSGIKLFKITKEKNLEGMLPSLFRNSYERYMLKQEADPDLVLLKLRNHSDNNYGGNNLDDLKQWEKSHVSQLFSEDEIQKYVIWHKDNTSIFQDLVNESKRILEKNLKLKNINVHDIQGHVKSPKSFENKLRKGVHYKPEHMQDLAGIRVICLVNSDVEKVSKIIESVFSIDNTRTKTRDKILNEDKMGYGSTQYVCVLPSSRTKHSENRHLKGKSFEVQVRTILQHAWSEIEHDDIYKNTKILTPELRRQFNLVSSILELADNELERLHDKAISDYA